MLSRSAIVVLTALLLGIACDGRERKAQSPDYEPSPLTEKTVTNSFDSAGLRLVEGWDIAREPSELRIVLQVPEPKLGSGRPILVAIFSSSSSAEGKDEPSAMPESGLRGIRIQNVIVYEPRGLKGNRKRALMRAITSLREAA